MKHTSKDEVLEQINSLWENNVPNWNFGKLIYRFTTWLDKEQFIPDTYDLSDEEFIEMLEEYVTEYAFDDEQEDEEDE